LNIDNKKFYNIKNIDNEFYENDEFNFFNISKNYDIIFLMNLKNTDFENQFQKVLEKF
jgi:hypothetical protein